MKSKKINKQQKNKRLIILIIVGIALIGIGSVVASKSIKNNQEIIETEITSNYVQDDIVSTVEVQPPQEKKSEEPVPNENPEQTSSWPVTYSIEQASSLTVVVNKKHKLPSNYIPTLTSVSGGNLRPEAASALTSMLTDAQNASIPMKVISSYRSYATQQNTYQNWVNKDGQALADTYSARPGHSEHQTGLAVDVGMPDGSCDLEICFGNTNQGKWLAANAQNYGFIVRYPNGKDSITGYQYEPWHLRYLGTDVAKAVVASGQTLDQYYGVEGGGY
jgi:D-alanyl-D-alanine carboxypeptidase